MNGAEKTKAELIKTAGEIFAIKGFKGATVREICKQANQSLGSVNYHFRDKEGLYKKVIEVYLISILEKYPTISEDNLNLPPETKLKVFISSFFKRLNSFFNDPDKSWVGKLLLSEILGPSEVFKEFFISYQFKQKEYLVSLISTISGLPKSDRRLTRSAISIIGQCFHYAIAQRILPLLKVSDNGPANVESITDHIFDFSIGGLNHLISKEA